MGRYELEDYLRRAEEAEALARELTLPTERESVLKIAAAWRRLAAREIPEDPAAAVN